LIAKKATKEKLTHKAEISQNKQKIKKLLV